MDLYHVLVKNGLGVISHQAKWVKWESMEQPMTSQLMLRKSSTLLLKATISVGHTNVKSSG